MGEIEAYCPLAVYPQCSQTNLRSVPTPDLMQRQQSRDVSAAVFGHNFLSFEKDTVLNIKRAKGKLYFHSGSFYWVSREQLLYLELRKT